MKKIDFSQLKEYDSLSKREQQLLREIEQENGRTNKITSLIEEHLARRQEIKAAMTQKNGQILDNESQVKVLSEQLTRLINQGTPQDKLSDYQSKISLLEEQSFALLEEIDLLENELKETHEFEQGARKTLSEIQDEVNQVVSLKQRELENLKAHQEHILNELPDSARELLLKLIAKKLVHGPFTKIESACCMVCRFKISKIDEAQIDVHQNLKQCPQCGRIFLPYGV